MALKNTGERLMTAGQSRTKVEHLHRYGIAKDYVKGKVVLDIASGEGYGSYLLSKEAAKVYGVDISKEAVLHAKAKYVANNLEYLEGSATAIPLPDHSVDVLVSFETIEHHDKHEEMILECKRVLKEDGLLIISSPDKKYYSDIPQYSNPFHVKELYKIEFDQLIKRFFPYVQLYNQGFLNCSVIYNDQNELNHQLKVYSGDFDSLKSATEITMPDYNLIIASAQKRAEHPFSIFEFGNTYSDPVWQERYNELAESMSYKIGNTLLAPFRLVRKLVGGK